MKNRNKRKTLKMVRAVLKEYNVSYKGGLVYMGSFKEENTGIEKDQVLVRLMDSGLPWRMAKIKLDRFHISLRERFL